MTQASLGLCRACDPDGGDSRMAQAQPESVQEALRGRSREELEEFALAEALTHAQFCGIVCYHSPGHGEEHRHATEAEIRSRIKGMSTEELIGVLAWPMFAGDLQERCRPGRNGG